MKQFSLPDTPQPMPYRVPAGYFDNMAARTMARAKMEDAARRRKRRIAGFSISGAAAAAAIAAFFTFNGNTAPATTVPMSDSHQLAEIYAAYDRLPDTDRDFLASSYDNDYYYSAQ